MPEALQEFDYQFIDQGQYIFTKTANCEECQVSNRQLSYSLKLLTYKNVKIQMDSKQSMNLQGKL